MLLADSAGGVRAKGTLEAVHVVAHVYGVNLQFDPVALTLDSPSSSRLSTRFYVGPACPMISYLTIPA